MLIYYHIFFLSGLAFFLMILIFNTFRVLVDRPMYEVIGGGGACFKTSNRGDKGKPVGAITLAAEGGSLTVASLKIYEMKSAWKDR